MASQGYQQLKAKLKNGAVVIMDGKSLGLSDAEYRGKEFKDHRHCQLGNCGILSLTQPSQVEKVHLEFLAAGADIIQTNTFCSNSIDQEHYYGVKGDDTIFRMNYASAQIARRACSMAKSQHGRDALVAGSIGPTHKSATIPYFPGAGVGELTRSYFTQARGLVAGGCDLILVESAMDWVNARAAIRAVQMAEAAESRQPMPVLVVGGIGAKCGGVLSGQSWESFARAFSAYPSVVAVGMNCGDKGPDIGGAFLGGVRSNTQLPVAYYPCAGLPGDDGRYGLEPEGFAELMAPSVAGGLVDIVGGCCGITPGHIAELEKRCRDIPCAFSAAAIRPAKQWVAGSADMSPVLLGMDGCACKEQEFGSRLRATLAGKQNMAVEVEIGSQQASDMLCSALSSWDVAALNPVLVVRATDVRAAEDFFRRAPCETFLGITHGGRVGYIEPSTCAQWARSYGVRFFAGSTQSASMDAVLVELEPWVLR
ncbi:Homocysteine S-methyltransferase [Martensiomyces pterosporus]|nr:Homocysteine S-methyltransferase [Martensiomyces pterosporus]